MCAGGLLRGVRIVEAVIFCGIPGCGKSSFFKERFFHSHVRISLDLLKTRHRERRLLDVCLATEQRFVIDNTNIARQHRQLYIAAAKARKFAVNGYYFQSSVADCLRRNALRSEAERVPEVAILSAAKKLEILSWDEGFDQLQYVSISETGFVVEEWRDDV